jgi:hypothetical protein
MRVSAPVRQRLGSETPAAAAERPIVDPGRDDPPPAGTAAGVAGRDQVTEDHSVADLDRVVAIVRRPTLAIGVTRRRHRTLLARAQLGRARERGVSPTPCSEGQDAE